MRLARGKITLEKLRNFHTLDLHIFINTYAQNKIMPSAAPETAASVQDSTKFTTPIAICGIGLRLPGGIRDCDSFWDLLVNGKDARVPIPASRYNASGYDGSLRGKGAIDIRHGYFIDEDLSSFDASLFSMSKAELEKCDPQQRLLLEVARESLDDAGEADYRGSNIGCYVANFGHDWMEMNLKELQHTRDHNVLGYTDMMLANRVSYEYDLRGPRYLKTYFLPTPAFLHLGQTFPDCKTCFPFSFSFVLAHSERRFFLFVLSKFIAASFKVALG